MRTLIIKILLLYLLMVFSFDAYTQNKTIDSLQKVLQTQEDDTAKVNTLNELANEVARNDPDTAIYFANKASELATRLNYKQGIADALIQISRSNVTRGNYETAFKKCNDAIALYDQIINSEKTTDKSKILKKKGSA